MFICAYLNICGHAEMVLPTVWQNGYPDGPEMEAFNVQLKQFLADWENMKHTITCSYTILDISNKTPQDTLQEMIDHMESMWSGLSDCLRLFLSFYISSHSLSLTPSLPSLLGPFKYTAMSISSADLVEEEEALHALTQAEKQDVNEEEEQESEVAPIIKGVIGCKIHFTKFTLQVNIIQMGYLLFLWYIKKCIFLNVIFGTFYQYLPNFQNKNENSKNMLN